VQVSGLDATTTEDAIQFYFESPSKGFGAEPAKIERQGRDRALVYFDDPSGGFYLYQVKTNKKNRLLFCYLIILFLSLMYITRLTF
jgi:hypothetical protein